MTTKELKKRNGIEQNKKLFDAYTQLENLLLALREKEIPENVMSAISASIYSLNLIPDEDLELKKQTKRCLSYIIVLLEKDLKIVAINHYRNNWMVIGMGLGMAIFGIPLGIFTENMGLIGLGIPLGMGIGIAIGANMDKKALESGRQLDLEIKY
ncbi:hypothetical protein [Flavicella sediminum]|uniref:hypothetical protein n=1 Tax=Flavicella sediminum TaxID=2585141 RepID=UPI001FB62807|nr:hypothetical protein [Flavicella sediminum]